MTPEFRCRDSQDRDFPAIQALWDAVQLGTKYRGDSAEAVVRTLDRGGRFLLLEELPAGGIAGTAWLTHDGRRLHLHRFAIRPELQGRGLGRMLLAEVLAAARDIGLPVKLEVRRGYEP